MQRRLLLTVICIFAACSTSAPDPQTLLPAQLPGGWTKGAAAAVPVSGAPEIVASLGLRQAARADYQGSGKLTVSLFEMNADVSAFELIQKWRQQDGLAAYKGRYFLTATWEGADRAAAAAALEALKNSLP